MKNFSFTVCRVLRFFALLFFSIVLNVACAQNLEQRCLSLVDAEKLDEAVVTCQNFLNATLKTEKEGSHTLYKARTLLSLAFIGTGRYKDAENLLSEQIEQGWKLIGSASSQADASALAIVMDMKATTYIRQEKYKEAIALIFDVMQLREQLTEDSKDLDNAFSRGILGEAYLGLGSFDLAEIELKKAEFVQRELNDADGLFSSLMLLAELRLKQKRAPEARRFLEQVWLLEDQGNQNSPTPRLLMLNAQLYSMEGNKSNALEEGKRAISVLEKQSGNKDPRLSKYKTILESF